MTKIITISGSAQDGKDTSAGFLSEALQNAGFRTKVVHYADLLKFICRTFFDWNGEKDDKGRTILQYVGTDVIRKENPDYWVDFIINILKMFGNNWDYVLIPDTRFPNEIYRLTEEGFDTVHLRVVRSNFVSPLTEEQKRHPSETALNNTKPDFVINNDGTLEDLKNKCETEVLNFVLYRGV